MDSYYTQSWIHLSTGKADRWLRWSVLESAFTGLLFIVALPWGPVGIARAWTASFWILLLPGFWYAGRPIGMEIPPFVAAIWRYVAASAAAGGISTLAMQSRMSFASMQGVSGALTSIIIASVLFWLLYLAAVVLLHGGYGSILKHADLLKEMLSQRFLSRLCPAEAMQHDQNLDGPDSLEKRCEVP